MRRFVLLFLLTGLLCCGFTTAPQVESLPALRIEVSKQTMTLRVLDDKDQEWACYPIACGLALGDKREEGDMKTPEGEFYVQEILDSSKWKHDFKDGKGWIKGAYGPYFIRLFTPPHKGIGIHGTHDEASIGTRATEGCIRLRNSDLQLLVRFVYVGMKVTILTSEADQQAQ